MKRRIFCFLLPVLVFLTGCSIQSTEEYRADLAEGDQTVILSIRCDTILSNMDRLQEELRPLIPADGILLPATEVGMPEGATAYDLLMKAAKAAGLVVNASGSSAYIVSINGIGEYDCGELSGWMFLVNGERPSTGCGGYSLQEGDRIDFCYTCDLGEDLAE